MADAFALRCDDMLMLMLLMPPTLRDAITLPCHYATLFFALLPDIDAADADYYADYAICAILR